MKKDWNDFNDDFWMDNLENNRSRPSSLGDAFGYSGGKIKSNLYLKQFLGSLLVMVIMIGIFISDSPRLAGVQNNLKYLLVEKESDYTPVLEAMVRDNIWLDPFEKNVFSEESIASLAIPVSGKIGKKFGYETNDAGKKVLHAGIDIITEPNAPVRAALSGKVKEIVAQGELGQKVLIQHDNGVETVYSLLSEVLVDQNFVVTKGDIIAKTLTLSNGKQGKIHFEVWEKGKPVDPLERIKNEDNSI